jgi:hypothetical protein
MKNVFKILGVIALVAVIGFGVVSCGGDDGGGTNPGTNPGTDPSKKTFAGTISISPTSSVTTGTKLTATYSKSGDDPQTVTFQWKKDGSNVGTDSNEFTPTEAGSYKVTISAEGYNPKDSNAVTVTVPAGPPQWTAISQSVFNSSYDIGPIAFGGGKFVASGTVYNSLTNVYTNLSMAASDNGTTWTAVTQSVFNKDNQVFAIAYGGDKFVAVGSNRMATSMNGSTWTAVENAPSYMTALAIAYGGGKFVAGGLSYSSEHKMATSTDGTTWTYVTQSVFGSSDDIIYAIAYGNSKFVAVGDSGKMATSTDGATWTAVTQSVFGSSDYIRAIAYGNGTFVAVEDSGKMATSADGATWTAVTQSVFGSSDYISAIAYGNGKFVAVGDSGKMATSADGTTWTAVTQSVFGSSDYISAITYGGGKFIAGGTGGKMAYLSDN